MAATWTARAVAEPDTRIDLECPTCGHAWDVAAVLSGVWWGRGVTPAAIAALCHCPACHALPPMRPATPAPPTGRRPPRAPHGGRRPAAAPHWSPEERAIVDELRARAGLATDADVIALALYRLAAWYHVWPSSRAFALGAGPARRRA